VFIYKSLLTIVTLFLLFENYYCNIIIYLLFYKYFAIKDYKLPTYCQIIVKSVIFDKIKNINLKKNKYLSLHNKNVILQGGYEEKQTTQN